MLRSKIETLASRSGSPCGLVTCPVMVTELCAAPHSGRSASAPASPPITRNARSGERIAMRIGIPPSRWWAHTAQGTSPSPASARGEDGWASDQQMRTRAQRQTGHERCKTEHTPHTGTRVPGRNIVSPESRRRKVRGKSSRVLTPDGTNERQHACDGRREDGQAPCQRARRKRRTLHILRGLPEAGNAHRVNGFGSLCCVAATPLFGEIHLRRLRRARRLHLEVRPWPLPEDLRRQHLREAPDVGVVAVHGLVVILPGDRDTVLRPFQLVL